jgi:RNA polymerase sigma-70 factor (ECF subfamily)
VDTEDRHLVEAFRRGEESAFAALVIKYRESVYRLARRMLGNHEDAADATQEVFLRAYRALGRFDGRSQVSTWLYRVTVNHCLDVRGRRARAAADTVETLQDRLAGRAVEEEVEDRQIGRRVALAVRTLPPRQKAMVVLRLYLDLPYAEIARIMGCSVGTVKATMFAALRRLRRLLVEEGVWTP